MAEGSQTDGSGRAPRKKTNRKMVVWVAVMGMVGLVVYLFASQGPDLGQLAIQAEKARQEKQTLHDRFEAKVPRPKAAAQRQFAEAQKQARLQSEVAHASTAPLLPPPQGSLFGPSFRGSRLDSLEHAQGVVGSAGGKGGAAPSGRPSFVVFQAGVSGKKGGGGVMGGVQDALTMPATKEREAENEPLTHKDLSEIEDPQIRAAMKRVKGLQKRHQALQALSSGRSKQVQKPGGENSQWLYQVQNKKIALGEPTMAKRAKQRYWLSPGTVIDGVTVSAMNTLVPGPVVARVTQPVYDSRYGRYLVIPAGSVLTGEYNAQVQKGQSRVLVTFSTLTTPSGGMIDLGGSVASDHLGRAGVKGDYHSHFWKEMGITAMMALEAVGMDNLSKQKVTTGFGGSGSPPMSSGGRIIVDASKQRLSAMRGRIGPNVTVTPGKPITLILTHGIAVPPLANSR